MIKPLSRLTRVYDLNNAGLEWNESAIHMDERIYNSATDGEIFLPSLDGGECAFFATSALDIEGRGSNQLQVDLFATVSFDNKKHEEIKSDCSPPPPPAPFSLPPPPPNSHDFGSTKHPVVITVADLSDRCVCALEGRRCTYAASLLAATPSQKNYRQWVGEISASGHVGGDRTFLPIMQLDMSKRVFGLDSVLTKYDKHEEYHGDLKGIVTTEQDSSEGNTFVFYVQVDRSILTLFYTPGPLRLIFAEISKIGGYITAVSAFLGIFFVAKYKRFFDTTLISHEHKELPLLGEATDSPRSSSIEERDEDDV